MLTVVRNFGALGRKEELDLFLCVFVEIRKWGNSKVS